ncbi:hybrid sensor histidine kinase/response regulator transcription factor [Sphingobacterium sp. LRF_L2]|uniref:hybrid sensor histidine kinase/response regulator transcription factor n=1 Tax=Sphingobacterium sp. LRF_L2 TaxID=3369421 RepID=UPI003F62AF59
MNKGLLVICFLAVFFNCLTAQDVNFRKLTSADGLSHHTVYAIAQDAIGFMWFGTREGLNQFDGNQIKTLQIDALQKKGKTSEITALLFQGKLLYIGTNEGLYIYNQLLDRVTELQLAGRPMVHFLLADREQLYVGTSKGLFRIEQEKVSLLCRENARAMAGLLANRFLVSLHNQLVVIDRMGKVEKSFGRESFGLLADVEFRIYQIIRDFKGRVWLATSHGVFGYDDRLEQFRKLRFSPSESVENTTVRSIVVDDRDLLFMGTEDGLYVHDLASGTTHNYQQSFRNDVKKLNDKAIYSTFISRDGAVWLGTYFGGVNYIPAERNGFQHILPSDGEHGLAGKAVSQLMEDGAKRLWIATEDGGISIFNPTTGLFSLIDKNSKPFYLKSNNVHSMHDDGYGHVWVGTFLGGLHCFNLKDRTTTVYQQDASDPYALSNNQIYAIYRDRGGVLWVGTQKGLNCFDYRTKRFSLFKPEIFADKFIYDLCEDKNGELWFCTRHDGIYRYNPMTDVVKHYTNGGKQAPLLSNQVISVYEDRNNKLWFGTLGGGVCIYDHQLDSFKHLTVSDGLANNNVYGILQDGDGQIWFSTNRGLSRYNLQTGKIVNYNSKHGLSTNQFNFKSFLKGKDGTLYFGTIYGLCFFNPLTLGSDNKRSDLVLTDFQLFNRTVHPDSNSSILKTQIGYAKEIGLSYDQNVFTISYIALDYSQPGSAKYAYYLEGFEDQWNLVGNKTSATYTNLSPGDYVFHVKSWNETEEEMGMERQIHIRVAPPFYRSSAAYLLYMLILMGMAWLYTRVLRFFGEKKMEVQLAYLEKEKTEALTEHRMNFFTFMSHEFKTPLTLILASIDKFIHEQRIDFRQHTELSHIKKNTSKLFKLIHQLAEFRRIEDSDFSVQLTRSDMLLFVRQVVGSFDALAQEKKLRLSCHMERASLDVFFDGDKLDKIVSNILSNAIKHTQRGRVVVWVRIALLAGQQNVEIAVRDTGEGLSEKDSLHLFEPFYRSELQRTVEGTGLGLALVHSLVKSLNGEISASSAVGKGTTIFVRLPIYDLPTEKWEDTLVQGQDDIRMPEPLVIPAEEESDSEQHTLLLVEDDKELLEFLSQHFKETYRVVTAMDGESAWKKIQKRPPDVIVSDLKMPKINGLELCLKLKQNKQFYHIPFILLSDSQDDRLRTNGLDLGADAYVGKPFNLMELERQVSNMVKSRTNLKEHVIGLGTLAEHSVTANNRSQDFLVKLNLTLERLYPEASTSIEDIAAEMCVSRTSLHLNLKTLLQKNATELLNEYRLKKALVMLEKDMSISDIAFHCGYRDANYFSRVFKKYYDLSPQKYKETQLKNI